VIGINEFLHYYGWYEFGNIEWVVNLSKKLSYMLVFSCFSEYMLTLVRWKLWHSIVDTEYTILEVRQNIVLDLLLNHRPKYILVSLFSDISQYRSQTACGWHPNLALNPNPNTNPNVNPVPPTSCSMLPAVILYCGVAIFSYVRE